MNKKHQKHKAKGFVRAATEYVGRCMQTLARLLRHVDRAVRSLATLAIAIHILLAILCQ
jgi:hypothetical protein